MQLFTVHHVCFRGPLGPDNQRTFKKMTEFTHKKGRGEPREWRSLQVYKEYVHVFVFLYILYMYKCSWESVFSACGQNARSWKVFL